MNDIKLYKGDCLELMKDIPDKSIDLDPFILTVIAWMPLPDPFDPESVK